MKIYHAAHIDFGANMLGGDRRGLRLVFEGDNGGLSVMDRVAAAEAVLEEGR